MSSESVKSAPPEGYKRVQLGPREITLPEEWGIAPVRELFEIEKNSFDPSELESSSNVMLYSMPAYDSNREPIRTPASEIGSKKYRVPQDTVLFPKLNIRKRRFWRVKHNHSLPAACSTEYWPLLPKTSIELDFYHYYFDSYEFTSNPKVTSSSSTNSHKRVKQSSFEKIQLPVPPLPEQRRIADILSTVDEQIQQTDEMIEKAEELKYGLMQDLLIQGLSSGSTQEVQIGPRTLQIPVHWDMEPCGQLFEAINGRAFKTEEWEEEGTQIIRIQDLRPGAEAETNYASFEVDGKYHVTDGDLLFCWAGNIKTSLGAYIWSGDDAYLNQHIYNLRPKKELDKRFFAYSLNKHLRLLKTMVGGSAGQVHITKSDFEAFKLPVPPVEEQKRIADIIQSAEKKVQREKDRKDKLQELKRGLMQDLLTGKVRVNTD